MFIASAPIDPSLAQGLTIISLHTGIAALGVVGIALGVLNATKERYAAATLGIVLGLTAIALAFLTLPTFK